MARPPDPADGDRPDSEPSSGAAAGGESVLLVDDNAAIHRLLRIALSQGGERRVVTVESAREAREHLQAFQFDVVVTDISMPDEDGLSLMRWSQENCPGPSWIVLTGHGTLDSAVQALQLGAYDFFTKPLESVAPLENSVRKAIEHQRLLAERDGLVRDLEAANEQLRDHVEQVEGACRLLAEQAETIRADLRRASLIQRALLPREAPVLGDFAVQALYRPSEAVGGDLYDVVPVDSDRVALVIADAAGHGLSAAMLAVLFRNQLPLTDRESHRALDPAEVLKRVNRPLSEEFAAPGLFVTAVYALLDVQTGALTVASAGHPPLLLRRRDGRVERIDHTGPALGLYPDARFGQLEVTLERGDRLLLHTDGIYDRLSGGGDDPVHALADWLEDGDAQDEGWLEAAYARLENGHGVATANGQPDDITLVVLDSDRSHSVLDNGPPPVGSLPAGAPPRSGVELWAGTSDARCVVSVRGRADWSSSAGFHDHCAQAVSDGRPILLDLSLCEHMDSTFLGTVHDLCTRADESDLELRLQRVQPAVEALFDELGMARVRDHIVSTTLPLPTGMQSLSAPELDPGEQTLRLLRAHEELAGLSERNRREFDPLIAVLRQEVETKGGSESA